MVVWASQVKNLPANAGDTRYVSLIPELARSPGEGNGNPLQQPCLENPMDRGAWWATVHGVTKSWTRLRDYATTKYIYTSEYCAAFKALFSKTLLFPAHLPVFWATYLFPLSPPVVMFLMVAFCLILASVPFPGQMERLWLRTCDGDHGSDQGPN